MDGNNDFSNLLTDPISFGDLLGSGATLQMNTNYDNGIADIIYDEIFGSDDDSDEKSDNAKPVSPWLGSFEELKTQMTSINEDIYKRILQPGNIEKGPVPKNSHVSIRYSSYWQGESAPFDSSVFSFNTGEFNVLDGLEKAVCTMCEGEKSQFIISYKLLFGEMGCPPRIKKRADGLYEIELISYTAQGEEKNVPCEIRSEDRKKFAVVLNKAKELHRKGLNFSEKGMYKNAAEVFEKAGIALEHCQLANEEDEKEQTKFLITLYTNLIVAYNKLKKPNKTCIVCRKVWSLTNNKPSCKVLFQKGRALFMLGEYTRAKILLQRAQRIEPDNFEIKKELENLENQAKQLYETKESIRKNLLSPEDANETPLNEDHLHEFKENMLEILQDFKKKSDEKISLPSNLTKNEINLVDDLAKDLDMKLTFSEDDQSYSICK